MADTSPAALAQLDQAIAHVSHDVYQLAERARDIIAAGSSPECATTVLANLVAHWTHAAVVTTLAVAVVRLASQPIDGPTQGGDGGE